MHMYMHMYDATAVELKTERRSGRDAGVWASGAQASRLTLSRAAPARPQCRGGGARDACCFYSTGTVTQSQLFGRTHCRRPRPQPKRPGRRRARGRLNVEQAEVTPESR